MLDICIVTYNRLEYLKLCVWSILASTTVEYRLFVISDNSTDGTNEWLLEMKDLGKIDEVIINSENLGSAESFNRVIRATSSDYFVMTCDDMWFHRGWDTAGLEILNKFKNSGIITFFNFPINNKDSQLKRVSDKAYFRQSTGLGSSIISRALFDKVGGFVLPEGLKMGYFAKGFCKKSELSGLSRSKQYLTNSILSKWTDVILEAQILRH